MKKTAYNEQHEKNRTSRRRMRVVVGAMALVFILVGLAQGEFNQVLQKAIRVCLECIGIG